MPHNIEVDERGNVVIRLRWQRVLQVALILAAAAGSYFLPLPGLTEASRICLIIFVGAAGLWITEAIPPFATATMVIVLCIYLLGTPGGPLGFDSGSLELLREGEYDLVVINILAPVIAGMASALAARTRHGGRLITAGLIEDQERDVVDALQSHRFGILARSQEKDWVCLIAERQ